jgi:hypothetical protein
MYDKFKGPRSGQLRKGKFTYAKSLLAQLQTSEQEPPGAA